MLQEEEWGFLTVPTTQISTYTDQRKSVSHVGLSERCKGCRQGFTPVCYDEENRFLRCTNTNWIFLIMKLVENS